MLSVLSPAKTMNFKPRNYPFAVSERQNQAETNLILAQLKELSVEAIMRIMKVSRRIAKLNQQRFEHFAQLPEKPALFAYAGDVYNNIDLNSLDERALYFAQDHLSIISALYGLLRPFDLIKAYRLEMSAKLDAIAPKSMYLFWQKIITKQLNELLATHKNKFLINLASQEYSAAIDQTKLAAKMINIHFRVRKGEELKNLPIKAKYARGMMSDFILRHQIDHPEILKEFRHHNYCFEENLSNETNFYYLLVEPENYDEDGEDESFFVS